MRAGRLGVRRPMILEDILVIFSSLFLLVRVSKVLQYRWIRWFNNNLVQKRFRWRYSALYQQHLAFHKCIYMHAHREQHRITPLVVDDKNSHLYFHGDLGAVLYRSQKSILLPARKLHLFFMTLQFMINFQHLISVQKVVWLGWYVVHNMNKKLTKYKIHWVGTGFHHM